MRQNAAHILAAEFLSEILKTAAFGDRRQSRKDRRFDTFPGGGIGSQFFCVEFGVAAAEQKPVAVLRQRLVCKRREKLKRRAHLAKQAQGGVIIKAKGVVARDRKVDAVKVRQLRQVIFKVGRGVCQRKQSVKIDRFLTEVRRLFQTHPQVRDRVCRHQSEMTRRDHAFGRQNGQKAERAQAVAEALARPAREGLILHFGGAVEKHAANAAVRHKVEKARQGRKERGGSAFGVCNEDDRRLCRRCDRIGAVRAVGACAVVVAHHALDDRDLRLIFTAKQGF